MNKILLLLCSCLLIASSALANEQYYPHYASSLPPLRSFELTKWGNAQHKTTGLIIDAPKGTVAIECLVNVPKTVVTVYKVSEASGKITSKVKLGEAVSSVLQWTHVDIPKATDTEKLYLKFDFSNAEGYAKAVIADAPVWPEGSVKKVQDDKWVSSLKWGNDTLFGKDGPSDRVPKPFVRCIREGDFQLKRFVAQPGVVPQHTKVRLRTMCFGQCSHLFVDADGDGTFDAELTDNSSKVDYFYTYQHDGVYYPAVCTADKSECLRSVVVVRPMETELTQVFTENVAGYWPSEHSFVRPYAERLIEYIQRAVDTGYIRYWGFERDWMPTIFPIVFTTTLDFGKEMCEALAQDCSDLHTLAVLATSDTVIWSAAGSVGIDLFRPDAVIHELGHALDHTANLSRALRMDYDILPIWRHEGLAVTFGDNIGYGTSSPSKHWTAMEVITNGNFLDNFEKLRSADIRGPCGGTTTECYHDSTSLCGVMFPIFWVKEPQKGFISYWEKLSYDAHEDAFPETFGYDNEEYWQWFKEWAKADPPDFVEPTLTVTDAKTLEFTLDGAGAYFILVYENGSAYPTKKLHVESGKGFSLAAFKKDTLESLRLFVRQEVEGPGAIPLLSEKGENFVILFNKEASLLFNVTEFNGSTVIHSVESTHNYVVFSGNLEDDMIQSMEFQPVVPEVDVSTDRVCFDFRPYAGFTMVESYNRSWHYAGVPIDTVTPQKIDEQGYYCYSTRQHGKYATFKETHQFLNEFYRPKWEIATNWVAVQIPRVVTLYHTDVNASEENGYPNTPLMPFRYPALAPINNTVTVAPTAVSLRPKLFVHDCKEVTDRSIVYVFIPNIHSGVIVPSSITCKDGIATITIGSGTFDFSDYSHSVFDVYYGFYDTNNEINYNVYELDVK